MWIAYNKKRWIIDNLSGKYSPDILAIWQKLLYHAEQSATDALKTALKMAIQKQQKQLLIGLVKKSQDWFTNKKINRNTNRNTNTNTIKFAEQKNVLLITWIISHIIITTALKKIYIYIYHIYIYIHQKNYF